VNDQIIPNEQRKVSVSLGIGIFFLPLIFSWFTLRTGYSKVAKIVSFTWLGFTLIFAIAAPKISTPSSATNGTTQAGISNSELPPAYIEIKREVDPVPFDAHLDVVIVPTSTTPEGIRAALQAVHDAYWDRTCEGSNGKRIHRFTAIAYRSQDDAKKFGVAIGNCNRTFTDKAPDISL